LAKRGPVSCGPSATIGRVLHLASGSEISQRLTGIEQSQVHGWIVFFFSNRILFPIQVPPPEFGVSLWHLCRSFACKSPEPEIGLKTPVLGLANTWEFPPKQRFVAETQIICIVTVQNTISSRRYPQSIFGIIPDSPPIHHNNRPLLMPSRNCQAAAEQA
jgi:hypothetical protein